uniref:Uncharacterized protein n=1 Tax=Spermophilus dauricus TaxID=99837 RepID=A0A8C9P9Z7_SPEDA
LHSIVPDVPVGTKRGSDELFSTCVTNGPFIMSSNSASAGNPTFRVPTPACWLEVALVQVVLCLS